MAADDFKSIYGRNMIKFSATIGALVGLFYFLPIYNKADGYIDDKGRVMCGKNPVTNGCVEDGHAYSTEEWIAHAHEKDDEGKQAGLIALGLFGTAGVAWYSSVEYDKAQEKKRAQAEAKT
ncbi:hypothetical protein [Hamadaea tsunoensis]|uniref:hypothetical protein n=1 Tax=Hamadaea tsunoensis TaxID=53368 RepID=UPI00041CB4A7|nr:hypothetical protein [Hamadaea tsunoensis]